MPDAFPAAEPTRARRSRAGWRWRVARREKAGAEDFRPGRDWARNRRPPLARVPWVRRARESPRAPAAGRPAREDWPLMPARAELPPREPRVRVAAAEQAGRAARPAAKAGWSLRTAKSSDGVSVSDCRFRGIPRAPPPVRRAKPRAEPAEVTMAARRFSPERATVRCQDAAGASGAKARAGVRRSWVECVTPLAADGNPKKTPYSSRGFSFTKLSSSTS